MKLKALQDEMKNLLFFRPDEPTKSSLWTGPIPERLDVYRNNTHTNWTDTLNHDFPLTRQQFPDEEWRALQKRYFIKHPPEHWELNTSMTPFSAWLKTQKIKPYVKELADYEWQDLKVFISRAEIRPGTGMSNPTVVIRAYEHQIFFWVESGAPASKPPQQRPEVLVFYRDSKNTCHIQEADPLMILLLEHFKTPGALLEALEPLRRKLLPQNKVALEIVHQSLLKNELIL
jgi:hypothetical protein